MAMLVANVGDVLTAANVNEYMINTKFVSKPSDTTRASNATLTNDPDLTVSVDANKSYFVELLVQYLANITPQIKTALAYPAGAAFNGMVLLQIQGQNYAGVNGLDATVPGTTVIHAAGSISELTVRYSGVLSTAGTAGSFTLQWAQDTSSVNTTIVRAGSFMLLRRCA